MWTENSFSLSCRQVGQGVWMLFEDSLQLAVGEYKMFNQGLGYKNSGYGDRGEFPLSGESWIVMIVNIFEKARQWPILWFPPFFNCLRGERVIKKPCPPIIYLYVGSETSWFMIVFFKIVWLFFTTKEDVLFLMQ